MDKWIASGDSLIPNALYKSYNFQVRYFPKTHVLQVEEKGKYYDDHAIIQFVIEDMKNVEKCST